MVVNVWRTLRMLLPVLAMAGIIAAPLAVPAAAMVAAAPGTEMADGMPCCPHDKPAMPDCSKACPLMAVCMAKCFQNVPTTASAVVLPLTVAGLLVPADDPFGASLAQAPPSRPPRT